MRRFNLWHDSSPQNISYRMRPRRGTPHPAPLLPGRPRHLLLLLLPAGPAATPSCPEGWRPGRAGRCGEEAPGPAPLPAAPGCHTPPQGLLHPSPSSLCPPRHSLRGGSEFLARKKEKRRHRSPHPAAGEATGRPARPPPCPPGEAGPSPWRSRRAARRCGWRLSAWRGSGRASARTAPASSARSGS